MSYSVLVLVGLAVTFVLSLSSTFIFNKCAEKEEWYGKRPFWRVIGFVSFGFLLVFAYIGWQISELLKGVF